MWTKTCIYLYVCEMREPWARKMSPRIMYASVLVGSMEMAASRSSMALAADSVSWLSMSLDSMAPRYMRETVLEGSMSIASVRYCRASLRFPRSAANRPICVRVATMIWLDCLQARIVHTHTHTRACRVSRVLYSIQTDSKRTKVESHKSTTKEEKSNETQYIL